jgi:Spy/CpxP family protein refolding chaperone
MTMRMNPTVTTTFVLAAVFAGGLMAGVLVERTVLAAPAVAEVSVERGAPAGETSSREGTRHDRETMARELELTPEQRARIDAILDEQQAELREIMSETRPRTRAVLRETRSRVEEVLTPEQRVRWDEMYAAAKRDGRADRGR